MPRTTGRPHSRFVEAQASALSVWDSPGAGALEPRPAAGSALQDPVAEAPRRATPRPGPTANDCLCLRAGMLQAPDTTALCRQQLAAMPSTPSPRASRNVVPTPPFKVLPREDFLERLCSCIAAQPKTAKRAARKPPSAVVESEVSGGASSSLQESAENCFSQSWVDRVTGLCHTSDGSHKDQAASAVNTADCHSEVVPTTAVDKATLTGNGAVVQRNGRSFVRARMTTGHGIDFLVKGSGDLRRDRAWQAILHEFCRVAAKSHPRMMPVPTYGVLPASEGKGGLVVLLPGSVTLFSLLPVEQKGPTLSAPSTSPSAAGRANRVDDESRAGSPRLVLQRLACRRAKDCSEWFASTRTMVSSIAMGSVLGAATGLGDRHLANIVVLPSLHVAHIDLQMLCGDGALLPVPETVPFRFTPIIADAAGCRPEAFAIDLVAVSGAWAAIRHDALWALEHVGGIPRDTVRNTNGGPRSAVYYPELSTDLAQLQHVVRLATDPAKLVALHESWMPWL